MFAEVFGVLCVYVCVSVSVILTAQLMVWRDERAFFLVEVELAPHMQFSICEALCETEF